MFRGFRAILYKETIHILRDPKTLILIIMLPSIELIIFGYAIDLDVKNIPTVIYNLDGRAPSRDLINSFVNTQTFQLVGYVHSDEELRRQLVRGKAAMGIKIPPDYSDKLLQGKPVQFLAMIDGSSSNVAMQALNVGNAISLRKSIATVSGMVGGMQQLPVEMRPQMEFNPDMRTVNFMVPGIVAIILQVVIMLLTALSIVKEKETGTFEQLMVSPISKSGLVLGKLLPYGEVGLFQTCFIFGVMSIVFHVPITGSFLLLLLLSSIFIFAALNLGLIISTLANSQMQATQLSIFVLLPTVLLSGFIFPQENMPKIIYYLAQFIPATYFIQILRGIILRGATLSDLWTQSVILIGMGTILASISAFRFKKTVQ